MTAPVTNTMAGAFWNEETTEINGSNLRRDLPAMPLVSSNIQTVFGQKDALIYLAHQVLHSRDKLVVVRAIASAISCIFQDSVNYTGSQAPCVPIMGLDIPDDASDANVRTRVLVTNFENAADVTIGELDGMVDIDPDELAAYFGVLCLAAVKKVTPDNRTAFNEKRSAAVRAQAIEELQIFTQNSPFLRDDVLNKVYAAFNSMQAPRAHLMALSAAKMGVVGMGPSTAFAVMFMLLVDSGMGALRIIKEAILKYPFIRSEFPELKPELALANKAQNVIRRAPQAHRPFLKAIYGSAFVPLPYQETNNLVGVCKKCLLETTPTYRNYSGGSITALQEERLSRLMERSGFESRREITPVTEELEE